MSLHYRIEGQGPKIFLAHALGCDLSMWDEVTKDLIKDFCVVRFDHLGHGQSPAIAGAVTIEQLADAVAGFIGEFDTTPCLYAGVSMGAMVGTDIAIRYPGLCSGMVLANSTYHYDDSERMVWRKRIDMVMQSGMVSIAEMAMARWLSKDFLERQPNKVALLKNCLLNMHVGSYAACCHAVAHIDFRNALHNIKMPVTIVAGTHDAATSPKLSEFLHKAIAHSKITYLDAAHISAVERPHEFSNVIRKLYASIT
jgi:3-oxoadipate enol-lactonase